MAFRRDAPRTRPRLRSLPTLTIECAMPPEMVESPWLEDTAGQRYPLNGTSSLGRASTINRYGFAHDKVSRRHVLIHSQDSGEFWIVDLGSTNGTYVNRERVVAPVCLQDGDSVNLGHGVELTFRQTTTAALIRAQSLLISTAHDVRVEERWILIADLEGYSALSKTMPPAELAIRVGGWLAATSELVSKNGGRINKYTGDGFLAFWREGEGVAKRVAAAVREFRELHEKSKVAYRVALHWGNVAIGGAPSLGEESLMSDDLSLGFRLEKVAAGLRLPFLMSAAAAERLKSDIILDPVPGSHAVKGFPPVTGLHTLR